MCNKQIQDILDTVREWGEDSSHLKDTEGKINGGKLDVQMGFVGISFFCFFWGGAYATVMSRFQEVTTVSVKAPVFLSFFSN